MPSQYIIWYIELKTLLKMHTFPQIQSMIIELLML